MLQSWMVFNTLLKTWLLRNVIVSSDSTRMILERHLCIVQKIPPLKPYVL